MEDKLDLKSKDIKEHNIEQLKKTFPEVVTEGKIDFEKLKAELGEEVENERERYEMKWPGKSNLQKIIQEPSIGTLKPVKDASVDFDNTENLFIEGDSLEVLKLLQKSYYGKIKMIYIDPPYNTGKDFVYPDNYSESLDTYLRYTGQKGESGLKLTTNTEMEGRFHSKWLNMMYPRLFLANNLLKDEGVMFISIDDHEIDNLKKICIEIFGEDNVEIYIWSLSDFEESSFTKTASNTVRFEHEYIVTCYKNQKKLNRYQEYRFIDRDDFSNPDNDPRGDWMSGNISRNGITSTTGTKYFTIKTPTGVEYTRNWTLSKEEYQGLLKDNRLFFSRNGDGVPRLKIFKNEPSFSIQSSIFSGLKTSITGKNELKELFNNKIIFDYPKPTTLVKRMVELSTNEEDIILDFFAGSGTTADATIQFNMADGDNRKFIMVQLQEPTEEDSEAYKAGYKNIAEIGEERIRRVIKKIKSEREGQLDLDENKQDLGFKVLRLDKSNFKIWDKKSDKPLQEQLELSVNNVNPQSSTDDILYEIILKSGFELSVKVEKMEVQGKTVYSVDNKSLLICLEKNLTQEFIKEVAEIGGIRVVFLDRGFDGNDQLKTNTVELMKAKGVEYKTV